LDATREYLLGRILLERRVVAEDDLRRLVAERDDALRRGGRLTLVQLLVRDRKIDPTAYVAIQNEIELRGRACFACRRAYLVPPGGPSECPQCGGSALLPALSPAAPPPPSGDYSPSGRFAPRQPHPSGSTRVAAAASSGSSGRGNYFAQANPANAASGSARLAPSLATTPGAISPQVASTDPGSSAGSPQKPGAELKSLGPYELLAELGRGGMGVVYKARHRDRNDVVALKVLLSGEFASPKMLARFKEEAATVQRLDHPNIVPVYEVGEIDGTHYFTMKFVEGDLLSALLKGRGLSARKGAELLRDVALGAHHAHEEGIVHRDLKPANVIVERETGIPFIMDFGLAKSLDDDKHLSKTGVALGTPYYMPPEQAQGKHREIDARSDVYALGAMLYEVLAKRVPFNAESQTSLLRKIVEEEPVPPSSFRQGVPEDLETIALKALRKKKEERYASAKAFAIDLKSALAGKEIKAQREAFWKPLQRKLAKDPKLVLLVVGCLLLALGAVAWGIHSSNEAERARQEQERQKALELEAQKKREAEEEAAKKRAEAESWVSKGHTKRFQARLASSWGASRDMIDEAASDFEKALELLPEGAPGRWEALYERALCGLDRAQRSAWPKALEDLTQVSTSRTFPARAHLALGFHHLRREHDPSSARKEFEAGRTPGREADDSKIREEEAAALVCRSYLASLDDDPTAAIAVARDGASRSDELGLAARSAELYARTIQVAGPSDANREAVAVANRLVADDKWDYFVHVDRAWFYSVASLTQQASESLNAASDICPDAPDHKVVAAWLKTSLTPSGKQALEEALATARADSPQSGAYWDSLERRITTVLETVRRAIRQFQENQQRQQAPKPAASHELYGDLEAHIDNLPSEVPPKIEELRSLLAQNRVDEAIEVCKKIEQLAPGGEVFFKLWRAKMFVESNRPGEARPIVESVLDQHPDDQLALTTMVSLEAADGHLDEARAACKKVMSVNPRLRTPRVLLAKAFFARRLFGDIPPLLTPLWEGDPTDYEAGAMLADALNRTGHQEDALGIAQKVVAADSKNLLARIAMSMSLRKLERYEEGARHIDASLQIFPGHWFLLFERGLTLWPLKRWDEAEEAIRGAVSAAPEKEKREIERQFEELKKKKPRS
jgi:serine/threonine protein kinase/tetratricopeptide (TPR) repeat protein